MGKVDLFSLLPKNAISRLAGKLASKKFPSVILHPFLDQYCSYYNVNMEESEKQSHEFDSFNDFFTRALKPGMRAIDGGKNSVVSPVDGRIYSCGDIRENKLLQAKNVYYGLTELIGEEYADFYDGGYQTTIYLSPADYHRIHTPFEGTPESFSYFPGDLWPVNDTFLDAITGLFSLNERLFTHMSDGKQNGYGLLQVGAMIVGKINVTYAHTTSNDNTPEIRKFVLDQPKKYARGEEIGRFSLGSTVILLFPPNRFKPLKNLTKGMRLKMGEKIGTMTKPPSHNRSQK